VITETEAESVILAEAREVGLEAKVVEVGKGDIRYIFSYPGGDVMFETLALAKCFLMGWKARGECLQNPAP